MTIIIQASRSKQHFKKNYFELDAWAQNKVICGIDEVGRGPLAGPVVTAAVILPKHKISPLLKDSKVLSAEERLKAYAWITKHCWYSIGMAHHRIIDQQNIFNATLIAMKKALINVLAICPERPHSIVVDAMPLKINDTAYADIPVNYFPFGESKSSSIAAASIVAKVRRDQLMERMDTIFTGYHLGQHKGYRTPQHKKAVEMGQKPLIIHRMSFVNRLAEYAAAGATEDESHDQQTLC
jgi:ribonuclease HII